MKYKDTKKRPVLKDQNGALLSWLESILTRQELKYLIYIVSLGFILRLVFILETQASPFIQNLFSDSKIYNDWAIDIFKKGKWFGSDVFFMSPFYPYFLAVIYKIFGETTMLVRIIQIVISSLNIVVIYLISRDLFNKQVGFVSAFIAAFYSLFIFYSGLILSETVQTFFISVLIYLLIKISKGSKEIDWLFVGLLIGISMVIRANISIFLLSLICWFILKLIKEKNSKYYIRKSLLYLIVGSIIPIMPITINNYLAKKDFVFLTSNGGINFYLGNNPNSQGVFITPTEFDFNEDMSGQKYAEKILNKKILPSEASSYWYERGLDNIINDPGNYVVLFIKKIFLFFGAEENPQSSVFDYNFYAANYSNVLKLPLFNFSFISYLAILGVILSWKEKGKMILIYLFLLSLTFATIIFFVNGRYRLALTPLLIVFASSALYKIYIYIKENDIIKILIPLLSVGVFIFTYTFIIPKPTFSNYDAYQYLGNIDYDKKDFDNAVINYNKSLALQDSYLTYFKLGNAYSAKKDFRSALTAFQKTINRNPNYAPGYFNIGLLHSETKNYQMAVKAFLKAIELNPDFVETYRNLAIVYYILENYQESLKYFEKYLQLTDDDNVKKSVLKDVENIKSRLRN
jgi:tetratricopeptide (TPR) repeat protein